MVEVGDNWSYKSCKAPVKSSPPTNQDPERVTKDINQSETTEHS